MQDQSMSKESSVFYMIPDSNLWLRVTVTVNVQIRARLYTMCDENQIQCTICISRYHCKNTQKDTPNVFGNRGIKQMLGATMTFLCLNKN